MNIIALTGNATKDLEVKVTQGGTMITSGTIAVRRDFKNKQTGEYETDFINFTAIGKTGEIMSNFIGKGDKFGINGRLQIRTWDNDQGVRQYFTEVIVNGFDFPDKKNSNAGNVSSNQSNSGQSSRVTNTPNYQQGGQNHAGNASHDPFSQSGGPVEVSDDLPF